MIAPFAPSTTHPDLRELVAAQLNELLQQRGDTWPPETRFESPLSPDDLEITCQRTWRDIACLNPDLNGEKFSACVARSSPMVPCTATSRKPCSAPAASCGSVAGMSGGPQPADDRDRAGGFMLAAGSHVTIGGTGFVPEGGSLVVELAGGSVYGDHERDGCAIVFASVTTEPRPDDEVVIRLMDVDGAQLDETTHGIGYGKPPPGVEPAPPD